MSRELSGFFTALITPFALDGSIDYKALENLISLQFKAGAPGVVIAGTTGETCTLSHAEHNEIIRFSVKYAKSLSKDFLVIACTGSNSSTEAIELTQDAEQAGADYSLLIAPYYNKGNQDGLYQHFMKIADDTSIPLIIYNVPARTVINVSNDVILKLRNENKQFVGLKDATGDLVRMRELRAKIDSDFSILSGDDASAHLFNVEGGSGVISVIGNLVPELMVKVQEETLKPVIDKSVLFELEKEMEPFLKIASLDVNPIPVKYACSLVGLCEAVYRLPLTLPSKEAQATIKGCLQEAKLL